MLLRVPQWWIGKPAGRDYAGGAGGSDFALDSASAFEFGIGLGVGLGCGRAPSMRSTKRPRRPGGSARRAAIASASRSLVSGPPSRQ